MRAGDRSGDVGPGRVDHRDQPEQGQPGLGVRRAGRGSGSAGSRRAGRSASTRRPLPRTGRWSVCSCTRAVVVERTGMAAVPAASVAAAAARSPGAPLVCTRCRPPARPSSVDIRLRWASKWKIASGARPRAGGSTATPRSAARRSSASSVGSPLPAGWPSLGTFGGRTGRGRRWRAAVRGDRRSGVVASSSRAGQPQPGDAHPVLGERPGLVGADHRRRAERLHRGEPLDDRALAGQFPHADGQRQRDRRQQSLGHVGHDQADGEADRRGPAESGPEPDGQERHPDATATTAMIQVARRT